MTVRRADVRSRRAARTLLPDRRFPSSGRSPFTLSGGSPILGRLQKGIPGRMLFLVISDPRPEPPSSVTGQRKRYWDWVAPLLASGEVRSVHAKVGRGAVALFDVPSNERLHHSG